MAGMDRVEIVLKITATALQDAAHLYLNEDDMAGLAAHLVRDPTRGRRDGDGYFRLIWRDVSVRYAVRFAEERITLYLMRLTRREPRSRDLSGAKDAVRDIALGLVRDKVSKLLEGGE